jgi:hypothetical protein
MDSGSPRRPVAVRTAGAERLGRSATVVVLDNMT